MDQRPRSRLRTLAGDIALGWQERILDRLRGRRTCPLLPSLLRDPSLAGRPVQQELERILMIVTGRRLTRTVMGDHPIRQSLTDFIDCGAAQAAHLVPFVKPHETILEYGGGIGRLGRAIAPHVDRLVSVDVNPLMKIYGPRISTGIDFIHRDELEESAEFDGAYSVAVFFHLSLERQRLALEYVHRRLKPGGWFLVDLKLGPQTERLDAEAPQAEYGPFRATALEDFKALLDPLFTVKRVPLFNSGFLLRKKDADAAAAETPGEGHYAVNEASVVFDVLEGQVVVVNLDNGSYYILEGTASTIWQMLAAGRRVPEIVDMLARHHASDAATVGAAVADFVAQLTGEALLIAGVGPAQGDGGFDESQMAGDGKPFTAPVMFRYTDMQALIQMDPIREYDESGWPKRHTPPPTPSRPA